MFGFDKLRRRFTCQALVALVLCLFLLVAGIAYFAWRSPVLRRLVRQYMHSEQDSRQYDDLIHEAARRHGISPFLIRAVIWKESRFRSNCVGKAGEIGLMQIMPGAVKDWCVAHDRPGISPGLLFDPWLNIEIGSWYLAQALRHWKGYESVTLLGLSEYNAGRRGSSDWHPESSTQKVQLDDILISSTKEYIRQVQQKLSEYESAPPPKK